LDTERSGRLDLTALGNIAVFELPGPLRNDDVEAERVGFYGAYDPASQGFSGRALVALRYALERDDHELGVTAWGGLRQLDLRENFTCDLVDPINGDRRDQQQDTTSFGLFASHESLLIDTLAL